METVAFAVTTHRAPRPPRAWTPERSQRAGAARWNGVRQAVGQHAAWCRPRRRGQGDREAFIAGRVPGRVPGRERTRAKVCGEVVLCEGGEALLLDAFDQRTRP